jgi:methionine-rich copper-binding protein CopC
VRRPLVVVLLAGLALLFGAGLAAAHNVLERSDPADGATLTSGPARVSLTFNLPVRQGFSAMTVVGPGGGLWQDGEPKVDGNIVSIGVRPLGPAGRYEVGYRIVSDDGHPVSGTISFTLTTPGTGTPAAPGPAGPTTDTAPSSDGPPAWPWVIAAAAVIIGSGVLALRLRRRHT